MQIIIATVQNTTPSQRVSTQSLYFKTFKSNFFDFFFFVHEIAKKQFLFIAMFISKLFLTTKYEKDKREIITDTSPSTNEMKIKKKKIF